MLKKYRDVYSGGLLLVFGVFFLVTARLLPANADTVVDPGTMPTLMGCLMSLLGAAILWQGVRDARRCQAAEEAAQPPHYRSLGLTILLLFLYILLWQRVGFAIMTALYIFAQTSVFCPPGKRSRRAFLLFGVIALAATAVIWVVFSMGFHLTLPRGILG